MLGEFSHIAEQISNQIATNGSLLSTDIQDIITRNIGEVNCYPGIPADKCHQIAFFIALHGKMAKGKGHMNVASMMEKVVQHMQGNCQGITKNAVIISNAWWHDHIEKWHENIKALKNNGVYFEAYLIGLEGQVSKIEV